jgi:Fe-Mn family superoxide dismutase
MDSKITSRRQFIGNTAKAGLAIAIGTSLTEKLMANDYGDTKIHVFNSTGFDQQPLPYAYNALEPHIDALTMDIHYSKHAATYCKNLKEAAIAEKVDQQKPIEDLLNNISKYSVKMRNNAGGHFNHEFFWQSMRAPQNNNTPGSAVLQALEKKFGSYENFKEQFTDTAKNRFGSGWAWLVKDMSGNLQIGSTPNQDNPLMDLPDLAIKGTPLLALDVWEHAYYLKYQNKRADYIEGWWNLVNWDVMETRWMNK